MGNYLTNLRRASEILHKMYVDCQSSQFNLAELARAQLLLKEVELDLQSSIALLPGWKCHACFCFNGESKEKRLICRACQTPKRTRI